jgi:hypothetical protein
MFMNNQRSEMDEEFYVGYFPEAPAGISSVIRKVIVATGIAVMIVAVSLTISQRPFSTAEFDYGVPTSVSGFLFTSPVPHVRVPMGKNQNGTEVYKTILLVGAGKYGVSELIDEIRETQQNIEGKFSTLTGFLIYGDGKAVLQINDIKDVKIMEEKFQPADVTKTSKGKMAIVSGEIVDPKCYFGVMKPGEGKPHRSCAIRCISGGIPPVFHSTDNTYFLLVDENFSSLNTVVLPLVGDHLRLDGEVVQFDDWKILKIQSGELKGLAMEAKRTNTMLAFQKGMTYCKK